jgi:hypothetical protein
MQRTAKAAADCDVGKKGADKDTHQNMARMVFARIGLQWSFVVKQAQPICEVALLRFFWGGLRVQLLCRDRQESLCHFFDDCNDVERRPAAASVAVAVVGEGECV